MDGEVIFGSAHHLQHSGAITEHEKPAAAIAAWVSRWDAKKFRAIKRSSLPSPFKSAMFSPNTGANCASMAKGCAVN